MTVLCTNGFWSNHNCFVGNFCIYIYIFLYYDSKKHIIPLIKNCICVNRSSWYLQLYLILVVWILLMNNSLDHDIWFTKNSYFDILIEERYVYLSFDLDFYDYHLILWHSNYFLRLCMVSLISLIKLDDDATFHSKRLCDQVIHDRNVLDNLNRIILSGQFEQLLL